MYKNLESSKFCTTFLSLTNKIGFNLDINNQFKEIKPEYFNDIGFTFIETINLSKVTIYDGREFHDTLLLFGFSILTYPSEFLFLISERQNIIKKLNKKVVRTVGLQISTSSSLKILEEFYEESKISGKCGTGKGDISMSDQIIRLDDNIINGNNQNENIIDE
jgi:hypothetical protein